MFKGSLPALVTPFTPDGELDLPALEKLVDSSLGPICSVVLITGALTAVIGGLLMLQPDFGQTVVFGLIWLTMLTVAGTSHRIIGSLLGAGVGGIVAAYFFYDTARIRIDG